MGIFLETLLKKHGLTVFSIGRKTEDVSGQIRESDAVIFSLPIPALKDFLQTVDTKILQEKLIVDLSSQVAENAGILSKISSQTTFIHFLFGPDITVLKNQHIVVSEKIADKSFREVVSIFEKEGARIIESSVERHDYMMALVQSLSQFNSIALAKTLSESGTSKKELKDFSSITFSLNAAVISRIVLQKPELWANIQFYNAFFADILKNHAKNIEALSELVRVKDHTKFDAMFEKLSAFWKDEKIVSYDEMEVKKKVPDLADGGKNALGVLGPRGSYSDQASQIFLKGKKPVFFDSISEVITALSNDTVAQAVLPLENSVQGTIFETLDGLYYQNLKIINETVLPIHHVIAGLDRTIPPKDIQTIFSHPQALGQCAKYIRANYPHAKLVLTPSTSAAFKKIKDEGLVNALAIGSKFGAEMQGLVIIEEGIQDMQNNETRFAYIAKKSDEVSVLPYVFIVIDPQDDRPGLLHAMLGVFKDRGINLLQLESRPARNKLGAYIMYLKMEIRKDDPRLAEVIREEEKFGKVTVISH